MSQQRIIQHTMTNAKIYPPHKGMSFPELDLCTLGRPFHRLGSWAEVLRSDLNDYFRTAYHQRDHTIHLKRISLHACLPIPIQAYSQIYEIQGMYIAVLFDRSFLLNLLEYRYGKQDPSLKQTETELRLVRRLGKHIIEITATQIIGKPVNVTVPSPEISSTFPDFNDLIVGATISSTKEKKVEDTNAFWIIFDRTVLGRLLDLYTSSSTTASTKKPGSKKSNYSALLGTHLHFLLKAHLCEQSMALHDFLDLRVGDIIPIHVKPKASVVIGNHPIFSATIAEHKNTLCLTSFEYLEQHDHGN